MSQNDPKEAYFKRQELQKLARMRAEQKKDLAKALEERTELHYNRCGRCGDLMKPKSFKGVEIDLCPSCGAVLLDPEWLSRPWLEDKSGVIENITSFFNFIKSGD